MPPYIQNIVFDNSCQEPYYAEDDIVGYEVRKKSIASNLWECLTGKKPKPEIYLFEEPLRQELVVYEDRPRQDVVFFGQECYDGGLALMPWRPYPRPYTPRHYHSEYHEETFECSGCPGCLRYPDLGRFHRPFPLPRRGSFHYDYHQHGHGHGHGCSTDWDAAPFWDPQWCPPRLQKLSRRSRAERRRLESVWFPWQREKIKLMNQRLQETRHERIYNEWPRGYSVAKFRQRNDRIEELDEKIEDLDRMQSEYYYGSDDGSTDYDFSNSDD